MNKTVKNFPQMLIMFRFAFYFIRKLTKSFCVTFLFNFLSEKIIRNYKFICLVLHPRFRQIWAEYQISIYMEILIKLLLLFFFCSKASSLHVDHVNENVFVYLIFYQQKSSNFWSWQGSINCYCFLCSL